MGLWVHTGVHEGISKVHETFCCHSSLAMKCFSKGSQHINGWKPLFYVMWMLRHIRATVDLPDSAAIIKLIYITLCPIMNFKKFMLKYHAFRSSHTKLPQVTTVLHGWTSNFAATENKWIKKTTLLHQEQDSRMSGTHRANMKSMFTLYTTRLCRFMCWLGDLSSHSGNQVRSILGWESTIVERCTSTCCAVSR